ncbi:MAG: hypothetical protein C0592_01985 [Marinilabiliales bacterium]|nr:MAG: hypothetical protein C0592_01985 [Marinilabiliales bacterium]
MKPHDKDVITALVRRDEINTRVHLENGQVLLVNNITYGYDDDDDYAHITANISPETGDPIEFFYSNEIVKIIDPEDERILFERN